MNVEDFRSTQVFHWWRKGECWGNSRSGRISNLIYGLNVSFHVAEQLYERHWPEYQAKHLSQAKLDAR